MLSIGAAGVALTPTINMAVVQNYPRQWSVVSGPLLLQPLYNPILLAWEGLDDALEFEMKELGCQ